MHTRKHRFLGIAKQLKIQKGRKTVPKVKSEKLSQIKIQKKIDIKCILLHIPIVKCGPKYGYSLTIYHISKDSRYFQLKLCAIAPKILLSNLFLVTFFKFIFDMF